MHNYAGKQIKIDFIDWKTNKYYKSNTSKTIFGDKKGKHSRSK